MSQFRLMTVSEVFQSEKENKRVICIKGRNSALKEYMGTGKPGKRYQLVDEVRGWHNGYETTREFLTKLPVKQQIR